MADMDQHDSARSEFKMSFSGIYSIAIALCTGGDQENWGVFWSVSQYKDRLSMYEDSHYKDKTVMRPSYLYDGNSYTGKTTSLYWDRQAPVKTGLTAVGVGVGGCGASTSMR